MTTQKISWENGLKLDCDILSKSDRMLIDNANLANYLPLNLPKGIFNFTIDTIALNSGLIQIKKLCIYIDNKKFINFDNSYPLSYQVTTDELAALTDLYINVHEKIIEKDNTKIVSEILSLSNEYDYTAQYSIPIARFRQNNTTLEPLDYSFPILSMDHYLMDDIFVKLNRAISTLKIFNKFIFSTSRPYASTYLSFLILKLKREVLFAEANKSMAKPYDLYSTTHDIYSLIISNTSDDEQYTPESIITYDTYKAFSTLDTLVTRLFNLCENKNIKNFVQFKLQGQKYVCDNLPEEFFVANKHYIVVKQRPDVEIKSRFTNNKKLRITSLSRYTNIVTLSLSGLKLEEINSGLHSNLAISLNDYDSVFEINKNAEWDFILVDKSAVFSAHEGSKNYDFFIAFV